MLVIKHAARRRRGQHRFSTGSGKDGNNQHQSDNPDTRTGRPTRQPDGPATTQTREIPGQRLNIATSAAAARSLDGTLGEIAVSWGGTAAALPGCSTTMPRRCPLASATACPSPSCCARDSDCASSPTAAPTTRKSLERTPPSTTAAGAWPSTGCPTRSAQLLAAPLSDDRAAALQEHGSAAVDECGAGRLTIRNCLPRLARPDHDQRRAPAPAGPAPLPARPAPPATAT
jgi:hypothetical protein